MKHFLAYLFLIFVHAVPCLAGVDLCQGLSQDRQRRPMMNSPRPALLQAFQDPAFGTTIRRITDVPASEGANAIIKPMYATMQAWNADESKLMLWHRNKGHELYDGRTYQFIRKLPISPTDDELSGVIQLRPKPFIAKLSMWLYGYMLKLVGPVKNNMKTIYGVNQAK